MKYLTKRMQHTYRYWSNKTGVHMQYHVMQFIHFNPFHMYQIVSTYSSTNWFYDARFQPAGARDDFSSGLTPPAAPVVHVIGLWVREESPQPKCLTGRRPLWEAWRKSHDDLWGTFVLCAKAKKVKKFNKHMSEHYVERIALCGLWCLCIIVCVCIGRDM